MQFQLKLLQPPRSVDYIRQQINQCELDLMQKKSAIKFINYLLVVSLLCAPITIFFAVLANSWGVLPGVIGVVAFLSWLGFLYDGTFIEIVECNEMQAKLKLLKKQLKQAEQFSFQQLDYRHQYVERIPEFVTTYRRKADGYRRWYTSTQLLTIFLSALITSVSGGWLDPYIKLPWITPVLGLLVSILTGITLHFRFREKGYNLQQTADAIDLAYNAHRLSIHDYSKFVNDEDQSITKLAEHVESLRDEQQKRQQQLEQSSQADQGATQKPASKTQRK